MSAAAPDRLEFRHAIRDALAEELERDERVVFFGEDVAAARRRVRRHRPGCASASAPTASSTRRSPSSRSPARPTAPPSPGCARSSRSCSATSWPCRWTRSSTRRRSSGTSPTSRATVPLVVRSAVGAGGRFGAIHSQIHATWFQGVPGLKIAFPSSPAEAKGLLKASIRDDNPVIFLEHKRLYSVKGAAAGRRRRRHPARRGERRARGRRRHDRLGRQGRAPTR